MAEIQVTVQTDAVKNIPCGTSGGVLVDFGEQVYIDQDEAGVCGTGCGDVRSETCFFHSVPRGSVQHHARRQVTNHISILCYA